MDNLDQIALGKYFVDDIRYRFSLPLFNKYIYIPEYILERLGYNNISRESLPLDIKLPGKLDLIDGAEFPCGGFLSNVSHYYEDSSLTYVDENFIPYCRSCFLGFDEKAFRGNNGFRRKRKSSVFFVARIPSFTRFIKDRYDTGFLNIATKKIRIEKIITADYELHTEYLDT